MTKIRLFSSKDDYLLAPIARSYNQLPWQNTAGKFAAESVINLCDDLSSTCTITLPNIDPALRLPDGKFVLFGYEHSLKNFDEELSRFFSKTSFGARMEMIQSFKDQYSNDNAGMASWLKNQIRNVPATLHRVFWRERVHHAVDDHHAIAGYEFHNRYMMREPCKAHSIWYDYAFDEKDWDGPDIVLLNYGGKEYVNVGGVTRTMLDARFMMEGTNQYFPHGTYKIKTAAFGSFAGGQVRLQGMGVDAFVKGGNPRIKIPPEILNYPGNFHKVNLPGSKDDTNTFDVIDPVRTKYGMKGKEGYRLKIDIPVGNGCEAIGDQKGDDGRVVGTLSDYDSTFAVLRHGAHMALRENSLESPCVGDDCQYMNIRMHPVTEDSCVIDTTASTPTPEIRCGSPGEVINKRDQDPSQVNLFTMTNYVNWYFWDSTYFGKVYVWHNIAQQSKDQWRQRVAWALAQMYPITEESFANAFRDNENFLKYYDIFVRNAFGNMKDILTEVSFSPLMGRFLTFVGSSSPYYTERFSGILNSNADENYARELMQLFTIGLDTLNEDGTPVTREDGAKVPAYSQKHVRNLARAWTGFNFAEKRLNVEQQVDVPNRFDDMWINGVERDPFPKIGTLDNSYIGDGYPLCDDLPSKHWLRKGARYRFLGSNPKPELGEQDNDGFYGVHGSWAGLRVDMTLNAGSSLYTALCNADNLGSCNFSVNVYLQNHVPCSGNECDVEMPRVVKVGNIYYEYIRPACVSLPFSTNVSSVISKDGKLACARKNDNESVMFACCKGGETSNTLHHTCTFTGSRLSYDATAAMCSDVFGNSASMCDGTGEIQITGEGLLFPRHDGGATVPNSCMAIGSKVSPLYWQGSSCEIKMKVNDEGQVAIVHKSNTAHDATYLLAIDQESPFYFDVAWPQTGSYPAPLNNCNGLASCVPHESYCLCDVELSETQVFTANPANVEDIVNNLKVGHPSVEMFDEGTFISEETNLGYTIYHPAGSSGISLESIFKVVKDGRVTFYKNMIPNVSITGQNGVTIRNPPTFLNLINPTSLDAFYETEAVIEHFFYHPNSPTFFALEFIKRLGTSNPGPDYVEAVASAYKSGTFDAYGVNFGDNTFGSLEATFAAIMFHSDSSTIAVDADPFAGVLREPTLSYHAFMRSMEMTAAMDSPSFSIFLENAGEEFLYGPGVFGFFDSNYEPDATFNAAGLVSAEASVYNPIRAMRMMNSLSSLIENGLTDCFEGFGPTFTNDVNCDFYATQPGLREQSRAVLRYTPSTTSPEVVVDELAMLLTGGRLNYYAREVLEKELRDSTKDFSDSLRMVQRFMTMLPEFHSTGIVQPSLKGREGYTPQASLTGDNYKAVVFMYLNGGMDGFNALVPHSDCKNGKDMYSEYANIRSDNAVLKSSLRQISALNSNQVCNNFGMHPSLEFAHQLYARGDLGFVANVGLLSEPCIDLDCDSKNTFVTKAHNLQRTATLRMDVKKEHPGKGVSGRLLDALKAEGYNVHGVSIGPFGSQTLDSYDSPHLTMSKTGKFETYNPMSWIDRKDDVLHSVTNTTALGSSRFSDIWGSGLRKGLEENEFLKSIIGEDINLEGSYSTSFSLIEKMIQTAPSRGVEREIFFTEDFGWDMHFDLLNSMTTKLKKVDNILKNFEANLKLQGRWDDVTFVIFSDFGRGE